MLSLVLKSTPGVWCRSIQFFWWCHSLLHQPISTRPFLFNPFLRRRNVATHPRHHGATKHHHSKPFRTILNIQNYKLYQNYPKLTPSLQMSLNWTNDENRKRGIPKVCKTYNWIRLPPSV